MIEKMEKLTMIIPAKDAGEFVDKLADAGVLHISHVSEPVNEKTSALEEKISVLEKLERVLLPFDGENSPAGNAPFPEEKIFEHADKVFKRSEEIKELGQKVKALNKQLIAARKWQDVTENDLKALRDKGLFTTLGELPKREFKAIKNDPSVIMVRKEKSRVFFAVIAEKKPDFIDRVEQIKAPGTNMGRMEEKIKELKKDLAQGKKYLQKEAAYLESARETKRNLQKRLEFSRVEAGMKKEKEISYVQGWVPKKKMEKIKVLAEKEHAGYLAEEPDDPERTPTEITNPGWIRIIEPVFKFMNTVPGYEEFDISFYFLVFFSIFFAMLIGDAGYGILIMAMTFFFSKRSKKTHKEIFFLFYLLSGATVVWGVLTGTWFGSERFAGHPAVAFLTVEAVSSFAAESQNNIIYLCFLLGALQLSIAHLIRAVRFINDPKALAELGWIGIIWGMFFAAGMFVLGRSFPSMAGWALTTGFFTVLVFQNFQKNILKGMTSTLMELPLSVISSFSDVVSYLRLFAVGYATVVLASTFNDMALSIGAGSIVAGLIASAVLVFGHLLNIILAFMAVIVHGIRLNMLEFSSHLGMQWSGIKYKPFSKKTL